MQLVCNPKIEREQGKVGSPGGMLGSCCTRLGGFSFRLRGDTNVDPLTRIYFYGFVSHVATLTRWALEVLPSLPCAVATMNS